ncbi:MAG: cell division protein FtsA [Alistipes sp.]|nr:cell division protein FtsA [Alistipes sp.]
MDRKNYTVAVDLGSSSVVVAVGETRDDGRMHVAAVVRKPVEGVNAGRIDNIELVSRAIREAVSEVEAQLGIRITEAYAGISGDFVRCARHTDHVYVFDPETGVSQKDVDALFDRMRNVQAPDDETIMERIPQNYMVDDNQEVKNPVGSFGKKLSSTFNFILCHKTPVQRLDMALKRLSIKMLGVFADALSTPEAVLLPEEKEEGVAVVDLGAGVTDVTVYYRNVVRYTVSIPMGASAINRDIRTMGVPEKHVESLKKRFGSAVAELASEDKLIRVNGRTARDAKDILLRNLATVIEARATDIAEFVQQEIKDSGYASKLAYGIVLTGGSAQLKDLDELFRRVTQMDVRVAVPDVGIAEESREIAASPDYATVVGLLLKGAAQGACAVVEYASPSPAASAAPAAQPAAAPAAPARPAPAQPRPAAAEPRRAFVPPATQPAAQPAAAPAPRPVQPRTAQPRPVQPRQPQAPAPAQPQPRMAVPQPAPQPEPQRLEPRQPLTAPEPVDEARPGVIDSRRKRDWSSIFQKAFDKVNQSFTAAEDEEI